MSEGTLAIWVSTGVADYLCVNPGIEYQSLYSFFYNKALLRIQAFHEFDQDPKLEMETVSNCLATLLHEGLGCFGHDAVVILAIEAISEESKDQANEDVGWMEIVRFFQLIQDYNKENQGECLKSNHGRFMTEVSSPSTSPSCKENSSQETDETQERNLNVKQALMDPWEVGEKMEPEHLGDL
ncbi:hypothetical protein AMTR_s02015p00008850 [Amborella trichopoda]|uniref:RFTS domain-containing protein n=1 Tax=Amborella trichopoda TaxID=13333 RepID=U5CUY6_AMBTC|nr:hypothetical protein AMTR_s02015p00008850 [Amborella trichopoda]